MSVNPAVKLLCLDPVVDLEAINPESTIEPDSKAPPSEPDDGISSKIGTSVENPETYTFTHELGRRYHHFGANTYWLPNDGQETSRLDLQHLVWRLTLSGPLNFAPLSPSISSAIDIGTGTGAWALDFARENPKCSVVGLDLSPIQSAKDVPKNCSFVIANAEEPWDRALDDRKFDFVHGRHLLFGIHDWRGFFAQAWDALNPGGWIEMLEPLFPFEFVPVKGSSSSTEGAFYRYSELCHEALLKVGIDTMVPIQFPEMLKEQGFEQIEYRLVKWPVGPWAKDEREKGIGRMTLDNALSFIEGSAKLLWIKNLGWEEGRVMEFVREVKMDMRDAKGTYFCPIVVVWGRKGGIVG